MLTTMLIIGFSVIIVIVGFSIIKFRGTKHDNEFEDFAKSVKRSVLFKKFLLSSKFLRLSLVVIISGALAYLYYFIVSDSEVSVVAENPLFYVLPGVAIGLFLFDSFCKTS